MKRFEVLYGDGKCSIREMPGEFPCDPDGREVRLMRKAADYFNCAAKLVIRAGVTTHIELDLPDDYEICGICGHDHVYDGDDGVTARIIEARHEEGSVPKGV